MEEATKKEETKVVECLTCGETVEVKLVPFGDTRAAVCPKCGKLAYVE